MQKQIYPKLKLNNKTFFIFKVYDNVIVQQTSTTSGIQTTDATKNANSSDRQSYDLANPIKPNVYSKPNLNTNHEATTLNDAIDEIKMNNF